MPTHARPSTSPDPSTAPTRPMWRLFRAPFTRPRFPIWRLFRGCFARHLSRICDPRLKPALVEQPPTCDPSTVATQKLNSKLRPTPTRNNRESTSNLFRPSVDRPQAREARKKRAKTIQLDSNRRRRPFPVAARPLCTRPSLTTPRAAPRMAQPPTARRLRRVRRGRCPYGPPRRRR